MRNIIKQNPLFFSFLLPQATDGIVTLLGQDKSYWQNFNAVNEMSPAYFFLTVHPIFFIIGACIWFGLMYYIFTKLKHPFNLFLALTFISGHSWGSTSWIQRMMRESGMYTSTDRPAIIFSWCLLVVYFALVGVCAGYCIDQYNKIHKKYES